MTAEETLFGLGLGLYLVATVIAVASALRRRENGALAVGALALALAIHGIAIVLRWQREGHGPYVDLFEILSSNVWSLHAALFATAVALPRLRGMLATGLPVLSVLVLWLMTVTPSGAPVPVTYETPWLFIHVWLGKVFLGCLAVALALGGVVVARRLARGQLFAALPDDPALDETAYRFLVVAFLFESLMLVAGAVWARDAWGRYWAWDPLETWAFVTWLALAAVLHLRVLRRPSPPLAAALTAGVFVLAFSTFFGMPFVSTAPHKGAI